jgi:hypothetical protein
LPHYTLPALPLLAVLLAGEWFGAGRTVGALRRWTAGMVADGLALSFVVFPRLAPLFPARELRRQSRSLVRADMEFASAGFQEPSLVWYFRDTIEAWHRPLEPGEVNEFLRGGGPRLCVVTEEILAGLTPEASWEVYRASGFNVAKGERVALALLIKP